MALISCSECSKQISDQAKSCPSCGAPTRKVAAIRWADYGLLAAFVFIGLIAFAFMHSGKHPDALINTIDTSPKQQEISGLVPLDVPSDPGATYQVRKLQPVNGLMVLLSIRTSPQNKSYSMKAFDCDSKTTGYIATGDTLASMENSKPDPRLSPVVPGTIADYQMNYACN